MLPNFLIIGSMKCGTTTLYEYLRTHPDVFMPDEKEPGFFANEDVWAKGVEHYAALFASAAQPLRGEASTMYTKPSGARAPQRIRDVLGPDVKLVYIVRDPLVRIRSHYEFGNFILGVGPTALTREALTERPEALEISRYSTQLERYAALFDRRRIHVMVCERMKEDRWGELDRLCAFLGAEPGWRPVQAREQVGRTADLVAWQLAAQRAARRGPVRRTAVAMVPPPVRSRLSKQLRSRRPVTQPAWFDPQTERWLRDELRPEVEGLRAWLGPDFDGWGMLD